MNKYAILTKDINGGNYMKNQKINCTVYDCKHCDVMNDACKLNQIKVACCRATDEKESTMCDNYVKTDLS